MMAGAMGPSLTRALGLFRRPAVVVCWALLAVGGSALVFLPLLGLPGYELSLALSVAVGLCGGAFGVASAFQERRLIQGRDPRPKGALRSDSALASAWHASAAALLLALGGLVPPLVASVAWALRSTACDPFAQVVFVLLLPLPSAVAASALGVLVGFTARRWWAALLLYGAGVLASLAVTVWPLLRGPQVYAFNHLLGWVPGPLYDEALQAPPGLWWFRVQTLLLAALAWCVAAFFLDMKEGRVTRPHFRPGSALLLGLLALGVAAIEQRAPALSIRMTEEHVREVLGGRRETEHFELVYPRGLEAEQVERFVRDLEFRHAQLSAFFGRAPEGRLKVFLYRTPDQKQQLVGARYTQFAKPWRGELHVDSPSFPHGVLKHELAHLMAAPFGAPPFGVTAVKALLPHPGVIEGMAVAADDPADDLTLHQWAAGMKQAGLLPDVRALLGLEGFFAQAPARAYTAAGSFLRWLHEQRGPEKLRALYRHADFEATYGQGLPALATEWEAFLEQVPLDEAAKAQAFARFRKPALMARPCAREVAALLREAAELEGSDPARAAQLYHRCAEVQPDELHHRLAEARMLQAIDRLPDAAELLRNAAFATKDHPQLRADVAMAAADVARKRGRPDEAKQQLEDVLALQVSPGTLRTAQVKLHAAETPQVADALWAYFGEGKDELKLLVLQRALQAAPDDAVLQYILGRRAAQAGAPELARGYLKEALARELPAALRREAQRLSLESAYLAGDCDAVRADAGALGEATLASRAKAAEWVERCDLDAKTFGGPLKPAGALK